MSNLVRSAAQHEAAHAIVARALGIPVLSMLVRSDGSGVTYCDTTMDAPAMAPVIAAGDLWQREFGTVPYRDGACSDLRDFERNHGLHALWEAERTARAVLTQHRAAVLALADRLTRERLVRFT